MTSGESMTSFLRALNALTWNATVLGRKKHELETVDEKDWKRKYEVAGTMLSNLNEIDGNKQRLVELFAMAMYGIDEDEL